MNARANKNLTTILQALAEAGQNNVASALNVDESTITRLKERLSQFAEMLAVCKMKIIPEAMRCLPNDYIESLENIARQHFNERRRPAPLEWD